MRSLLKKRGLLEIETLLNVSLIKCYYSMNQAGSVMTTILGLIMGIRKTPGPYFGYRTVKLGLIPDTRQPSPVMTAILDLIVDCENLQGPYVAHRAAS